MGQGERNNPRSRFNQLPGMSQAVRDSFNRPLAIGDLVFVADAARGGTYFRIVQLTPAMAPAPPGFVAMDLVATARIMAPTGVQNNGLTLVFREENPEEGQEQGQSDEQAPDPMAPEPPGAPRLVLTDGEPRESER